jgi:hypothetical protein
MRTLSRLAAALVVAGLVAAPVIGAEAAVASASYSVHYMTLNSGRKVVARWNPCRPHTYKVNVAAVPAASRSAVLAEAQASMRAIAHLTGMAWVYKGTTAEVPRHTANWFPAGSQSAELVIAYTTPAKTNYPLAGSMAGYGGESESWGVTGAIYRGFVVIDTPDMLRYLKPGFGLGTHRGNLIQHVLGHAVGLGHVSSAYLLMYPSVNARTPYGFAAGDRAGLAAVGRKAGCIAGR